MTNAANGTADPHRPIPLPVQHVLLLDHRAADLRREYLATCPPSTVRALCTVHAEAAAWKDRLLAILDSMTPEATASTVVVVAEFTERARHPRGLRVARLHPGTAVFVLDL